MVEEDASAPYQADDTTASTTVGQIPFAIEDDSKKESEDSNTKDETSTTEDPTTVVTPPTTTGLDPTSTSKSDPAPTTEPTTSTPATITYRSGVGGSVRSDSVPEKEATEADWSSETSSFYTTNTRKEVAGAIARTTEGFHFDGWVDLATGTTVSKEAHLTPAYPSGGWAETTTYLATFSPVNFLLVLDPGEGTGSGYEVTQTYGKDVALPAAGSKAEALAQRRGYALEGWAAGNAGTTLTDGGTLTAAAQRSLFAGGAFATSKRLTLTLRAVWKELTATISYLASKGGAITLTGSDASKQEASEEVGQATGTPVGATATASRGYHFVDWEDSDGTALTTNATLSGATLAQACTASDSDDAGLLADTSVTAAFSPNTYKLAYGAGMGTATGSATDAAATSLTYGSTATAADAANLFARTGYVASGWSTASDGTGTAVADGATITTDLVDRLIEDGTLKDADGATLTLYPTWTKAAEPVAPVEPTTPAEPTAPAVQPAVEPEPAADPVVTPAQVVETVAKDVEAVPAVVAEVAQEVVEAVPEAAAALQVPTPAVPIVTRDSTGMGGVASGIAGLLNMSPAEAAQAVGNTVTTMAGVGAAAAILGAGASIMGAVAGAGGAVAASSFGVTGVAGASDIAAELAAQRKSEGKPTVRHNLAERIADRRKRWQASKRAQQQEAGE